jgi:hypothetical protein
MPARTLQDHPAILERAYRSVAGLIRWLEPLLRRAGLDRLEALFVWGEHITKGPLFDCQMCGVCNLRGTGMTCPMTCPKEIRNGPCGGVRPDGKCEVKPEMDCIWVLGWGRAANMETYGDRILTVHPPLDYSLKDTSAWLNMLTERDQQSPDGWSSDGVRSLIPLTEITIHE